MSGIVQLSPILTTARDILKEHNNKAMHVNEIADVAVKSARNQSMTADDFASKFSGALSVGDLLSKNRPDAANEAVVFGVLIAGLSSDDRAFVMTVARNCYDYLENRPPVSRLGLTVNNVMRNYI